MFKYINQLLFKSKINQDGNLFPEHLNHLLENMNVRFKSGINYFCISFKRELFFSHKLTLYISSTRSSNRFINFLRILKTQLLPSVNTVRSKGMSATIFSGVKRNDTHL